MNTNTSRRNLIKKIAAGSVAAAVSHPLLALASENMKDIKLKGNINHSVCQWTYGFMPLEELCAEVKKMGLAPGYTTGVTGMGKMFAEMMGSFKLAFLISIIAVSNPSCLDFAAVFSAASLNN